MPFSSRASVSALVTIDGTGATASVSTSSPVRGLDGLFSDHADLGGELPVGSASSSGEVVRANGSAGFDELDERGLECAGHSPRRADLQGADGEPASSFRELR
jgi:hypothetical protein